MAKEGKDKQQMSTLTNLTLTRESEIRSGSCWTRCWNLLHEENKWSEVTNAEDSSDDFCYAGDPQPLFRPKTLEDENDELADQVNHLAEENNTWHKPPTWHVDQRTMIYRFDDEMEAN